eukprot:TRINITY_DN604_c1_g1_i1.p1 TRINITY_DN604_c1_g1~~TRINITY_DN604_c1_g1_i1.p1  ORF type:complete len:158 (-),score=28.43 TRINITY_DN604_c1_g1_i1:144-617(-)
MEGLWEFLQQLNNKELDFVLSSFVYDFKNRNWAKNTCRTKFGQLCGLFEGRGLGDKNNRDFKQTREAQCAINVEKIENCRRDKNRSALSIAQLKTILASTHCDVETPMGLITAALFIFGIGFGLRIMSLRIQRIIRYFYGIFARSRRGNREFSARIF